MDETVGLVGDLDEAVMGDGQTLADLTTEVKTSIVDAINEIVTRLEVVEGEGT